MKNYIGYQYSDNLGNRYGRFPHLHQTVKVLSAFGAFRYNPMPVKAMATELYNDMVRDSARPNGSKDFLYPELIQDEKPLRRGFSVANPDTQRLQNVLYGRHAISEVEASYFYQAFCRVFGKPAQEVTVYEFLANPIADLIKGMIGQRRTFDRRYIRIHEPEDIPEYSPAEEPIEGK